MWKLRFEHTNVNTHDQKTRGIDLLALLWIRVSEMLLASDVRKHHIGRKDAITHRRSVGEKEMKKASRWADTD
jgi:hypothetical protein